MYRRRSRGHHDHLKNAGAERNAAGEPPTHLMAVVGHGNVMAHRKSGERRGEAGNRDQRQGHQHGHEKKRHIFRREDLPAGHGQETVARHSALAIETEERLRISRNREHNPDRHRQQGFGRQESGRTIAQGESAHHGAAPEIESRKRLAQVLADEMI